MSSERESEHVFELRLEGGTSFGFGPPRPGDCGLARMLRVPDFCRGDAQLARYFNEQAKAQWELSPITRMRVGCLQMTAALQG